ncbi:MAG TPA: primosomal protein N' [Steroidobacteraceae bacterium]|nr:primosomal protein N' [Steroidobacteraceae bacterium]
MAVNAPLRRLFDYLPPPDWQVGQIPAGSRVRVPLGTRQVVGMVVSQTAMAPQREVPAPSAPPAQTVALSAPRLKAIQEVIDAEPLLTAPLMQLLQWTAAYYHHPLGEVIAAALPRGLREGAPAAAPARSLRRWQLTAAGAAAALEDTVARAPAQRALLGALAEQPDGMVAAQLAQRQPGWQRTARVLERRGWVTMHETHDSAPSAADTPVALATSTETRGAPTLSAPQADAVDTIDAAAGTFGAFVLQGATGSGKTEVYLQCAARTLARGRGVLLLVPEIALTPQLVERFRARLPGRLGVLHSGLSDAERLAAWRMAREGTARIVLGTRSAVFAPLAALGLIIVDEEHDSSYKQQESGCRYSARDVAVVRAQQGQLPIVLGSATPALETLQNIATGRYRVLQLPRRADQAAAPLLRLVDMRAHAVHQGLSTPVLESMRRHLQAGSQVLVFINRRGYAPTLLCTGCGWIAPCAHCDARLTVHRVRGELRCHHCGAVEALPERCARCGHAVKPVGQGTERIEQTLQELFPEHPLLRLDRDTAARPAQLDQIVTQLRDGQARILVGTQMVTKGHHFPAMMLAVVLNADQGLFSSDFRAAERLAQTIVQVAGRAGRERAQGEVLIQTEYPDHPLLLSLLQAGYEGFAEEALAERRAARWPPFARLAMLRASSTDPQAALAFLSAARAAAPADAHVRLLGPVSPPMARRADRYYAQLLAESTERGALHRFLEAWLTPVESLARTARVRFALDVDPLEIG